MHLHIIATGKCRHKPLLELEAEYTKRLPKHWQYQVTELPEAATPQAEAKHQLAAFNKLAKPTVLIALDETGQHLTSPQFAQKLESFQQQGTKSLAILIGGANGLHASIRQQAQLVLAFGKLTFPHQLVRVLVAEQLYRAHTLLTGHPYHRA
ncbi:MAG: 23S rRNA (pseudouridine(1915)-N(3))-methyltransferase RlmH [Proteobacteria bacterium]|nr:23S rRNA (pseudouridine(1915)-N(3))-methyltransferase RlmH [Pseudomonadota bacterium]NBX85824.1 23S rRNA (pseudouridine(1915)-N(3))-methyltransferase RlmH [Pseudomonadota bacterium]